MTFHSVVAVVIEIIMKIFTNFITLKNARMNMIVIQLSLRHNLNSKVNE